MTVRGILQTVAAAWLAALMFVGIGHAQAKICDRAVVSPADIAGFIADDLNSLAPEVAKDTRYFTLFTQVNACTKAEELQVHRHAVVKLLNSLSWSPDVLPLETIGDDRAIIRVRLSRLGWTSEEWLRLLRVYPYALQPDTEAFATARDLSASPLPYVRGDWFVHTVSRPPYYYVMLKLPRSFIALKRQLGDEAAARVRSIYARRGGYQPDRVDGRIRFAPAPGYSDQPFTKPARADADALTGANVRIVPNQTHVLSTFALPNGFRGYLLHHEVGPRLNASQWFKCPECSFAGFTQDDGKLRLAGLYPVSKPNEQAHREDAARLAASLKAAGLDPEATDVSGGEPIATVSRLFRRRGLDLNSAGAELGLLPEVLEARLRQAGPQSFHHARVLAQLTMRRDRFQAQFKRIAEAAGIKVLRNETIGKLINLGLTRPRAGFMRRPRDFSLTVVSDKSTYRAGELLQLSVQPQLACNLTLISVAGDGKGTVLFPNRYQQETFIPAGKIVTFPGPSTPFKFRLNDRGEETIVSFCNASSRWSGVKHDFGKAPFTALENFEAFLTDRETFLANRKPTFGRLLPLVIAESSLSFTVE